MDYLEERNLYRFTVMGTETDIEDRLHYHALCSMLQEAACLDADRQGCGSNTLDQMNACWLILRMKVCMTRIPKWRDEIYVRTVSHGYQRVFFNRDFDIYDSNFEPIGWATSVWVITEQGSHRPIRPASIPGMEALACQEPSSRNVEKLIPVDACQRDEGNPITRYADYSDIDRNMHVNNTRYIAWSEDSFYLQNPTTDAIKSLVINYSSEVKTGEEVKVFRSTINGSVQVDGFEVSTLRHVFSARFDSDVIDGVK